VVESEPVQCHRDHHDPGRHDGPVELHKAMLPEDLLVGRDMHTGDDHCLPSCGIAGAHGGRETDESRYGNARK
jgi:hypothetical protein